MSNQLQALLKSNKIDIVVDLNKEKSLSNIKSGLQKLTKDLDGFNIDLGVKFNPNVKELNKEIKALQNKISDSKSVGNAIKFDVEIDTSIEKLNNDIQRLQSKIQNAKTIKPIKLDVVIDVQGSAKKITNELGQIKEVLDRFKNDYSKALSNIKELGNSEFSELLSDQTVRKLSSNVDNVKNYMRDAFGDGLISTKTIKDSEDNIMSLSATIKKETGEIHTSFFKLNESGAFELIKQEDINKMEEQTAKAKRSINSLTDEIEKIKGVMKDSKSFDMFNKLGEQEFVSAKEVENLKALVRAEKDLIATNQKRKEFQDALTRSLKMMSPEVSEVAREVRKLDQGLEKVDSKGLDRLNGQLAKLNSQYKADEQVFNKRSQNLKEINTLENKLAITYEKMTKSSDNLKMFNRANDILRDAKATSQLTDEMGKLNSASNNLKKVQSELSNINLDNQLSNSNASMRKQVDSIEKTITALKSIGKYSGEDVTRAMAMLEEKMATSERSVRDFGQTLKKEFEVAKQEQKDLINGFVLIEKHTQDSSKMKIQSGMFNAINSKDTSALKEYIGTLKNGEVSTISMSEKTNQFGQAVDQIKVKMAGTGKTVEAYTFEVNKASDATGMMVKETGRAVVDNENKALGFMEQMGIAMKRVPSWIISMQSFYAVINGFKSVGKEIMQIDAELIEIRRVASDGINVDSLFSSAVVQAKELGNNIHEVTNSLGDFARTYGEFTEAQLLAVNKTAVIMSNVSELTLEQASNDLVGTMNAFNIKAEESIHIVDALNEVDNNYAVSTMQLSGALSKAGATAKTFGLTMEEVLGHTTAIGAVTMESGDIIGNSLKTIYSRVTTMKPAIDILDSVGVSIKQVGENGLEMRNTGDILGDLAGKWSTLSSEQQQNIGVTVAGRNQLSRFLALMNNWGMAQDSTTSAINSTGSALKEQDIYMGSYEAKLNGVKTRFTELSLAIGEAFLSDGMFVAIQGIADLTDGLTQLVSKVGVLPVFASGIALVGGKMSGLTGEMTKLFSMMQGGTGLVNSFKSVFISGTSEKSGMLAGIVSEFGKLKDIATGAGKGFSEAFSQIGSGMGSLVTSMTMAKTGISGVTVAQTGLSLATGGVSMAFTTAKTAVLGFLSTTAGIGLAIAGVGFVVGKLVEKMIKAKHETDELVKSYEEATTKAVEAYNLQRTTFDKTISEYNKLNSKGVGNLNTKELEEYKRLTSEIANILPNAVKFVDANGVAHLKNAKAIEKEAQRTRDLAKEQARLSMDKQIKEVEKLGESYEKLRKSAEKNNRTIKNYENQPKVENIDYSAYGGYDYYPTVSAKQYEEAVAGAQKAQGAMSLELSKSAIAIGEYAKSAITASTGTEHMTDSGLSMIDQFAKINQVTDDVSMSTEEYAKSQEKLQESTEKFAKALSSQYEELDKIGGQQAEKAKEMMDTLIGSMDDDFFTGKDIEGKLSGFAKAIQDIAGNAENFDITQFQNSLIASGLSTDEAKQLTMQFGTELENSAIKSAIANDELVVYNDTLNDMTEKIYEAIDAQKTLLGLADGEKESNLSRLEYLKEMKKLRGDKWLDSGQVQLEIQNLVDSLGLSETRIKDSTENIYDAYRILTDGGAGQISKLREMTDEELTKAYEGIDAKTISFIRDAVMNMSTGGMEIQQALILAISQGATELDSKIDEINKSFAKLQTDPNNSNYENAYLNKIKNDLKGIEGQYAVVEEADGKFKLGMLNGQKSEYLELVNGQLEEMGLKLEKQKGISGEDVFGFVKADGTFAELQFVNAELGNTLMATQMLKDNFDLLKGGFNEETQSQWINGIKNQMSFLNEDLKIVGEGTEEVKLAFASGNEPDWLKLLNSQVKELGGELVTTKDKAGNLTFELKNSQYGDIVLFKQIAEEAKTASTDVNKTTEDVKNAKKEANEGATLDITAKFDPENLLKPKAEQSKTDITDMFKDPFKANVELNTEQYNAEQEKINQELATPKEQLVEFKMIEQADGSIETMQSRLKGLLENVTNLQDGVSQTVSLIDNDLLSKNPLMQTMADKLNEIAQAGNNAKKAVDELNKVLSNTKFEVTGKIDIGGIDDAQTKIKNLAKEIGTSQSSIKTAMSSIQGSLNGLKIGAIDTSALTSLKTTVSSTMTEVQNILSGYGQSVANAIASANNAMVFNSAGLLLYRTVTVATVQSIITSWTQLRGTVPQLITQMSSSMVAIYVAGTQAIDARTVWLQQNIANRFANIGNVVRVQMINISNIMTSEFRRGTSGLYAIASDIPRQIGAGISNNMASATGSLQTLADNMVRRFKEALGIHSPSRVFEELGGFVIQGLTNGLSGGDLKSLGTNVFKDFGGGIFDSMDMIKAYLSGDFSSIADFAGGGGDWAPMIMKAAALMGEKLSPRELQGILAQIQRESGGNQAIVQSNAVWDVNTANGNPARGLLQYIPQTFNAYKVNGFDNIYNGFHQLLAFFNNTNWRHDLPYGNSGWGPSGGRKRYANGGFITEHHIAEVGEEGEEVVIPLIEKRRKRGIDLWMKTAEKLGITSGLSPMFNSRSGYARGGMIGGFNISDGGSSEGSSSGEANAGIVKPQPSQILQLVKPVFANSAEKAKLDPLYKRDTAGLNIELTESYLTKANQKLKTLNENTLAYRNQVLAIQRLNKTLLSQEKAQLSNAQKRQKQIEKELKALKNTGAHTEEQRKKWNDLQQEYDNNTKKIWKLEESIDSLNTTIMDANYENHIDYLHEIANKWQDIIDGINKTTNNLDFNLQKLQLTDEHDVGGQLKIRYDMLEQQMKLEKTYQNQVASFKKEYDHLVKIVGKDDKRTLEAKKLLDKAEEDYQKSILETLKLEKSIKDERTKVATDSINALKTYYKQMETLSKSAIAKEKENLKKAHEEKIKQYDDEISKINEIYDAKLKQHNDEKSEQEYTEKMNDYNDERTKLMQQISMASKDTSLEGRKKLSDLQKQLMDLNKEISKAQADRQEELWKKELENQKEQQLDKVKNDKENQTDEYNKQLDEIEKREKEIMDYYKKMSSDETAWKEATDAWNNGDTSILTDLMNAMRDGMSAIMGGDGTGIMGSENLSPEDIKELLGDSMLDVSNIWLDIADQLKELNSINKNLDDLNANSQKGGTIKNPVFTDGGADKTKPTTSQPNVEPIMPKDPPKPTTPTGIKGYHTVVGGDTLWDLAKKYYGNYYQWQKIQKANGNIDPYRLPIGKKLAIPFRSGGYTGDWMGDDGKIAMLHKKELVLNQQQTRDILDTVSILDKAKSQMSDVAEQSRRNRKSNDRITSTTFGDINLYFDGFKGTKDDAEFVTDAIMEKLKKKR